MAKSTNSSPSCGQAESVWYDGPWENVLGRGVSVSNISVARDNRKVNVKADLEIQLKERTGIEWMIVVFGLYSVNSMLHMESLTNHINKVTATEPDSPLDIEVQFHDRSTRKPFLQPDARVLAVLVRSWEAQECGLG